MNEKAFLGSNEILQEKTRELNQKVAENKEVKRQMDFLKKEFANDSNFEWMNETQNRIKTDKKTLAKLKDEN